MLYLPEKWEHGGIFGTTGVGKSTLGEFICEIMNLNKNMKIIDLQNNKYLEACSFMRPTHNKRFRAVLMNANLMINNNILKPRGFQTEIFHPISINLPPKLPEAIKLYTLPMQFFAYEDVLRVLTGDSLTDAAYVSLSQELEKLKKTDSFPALPSKIVESVEKKFLRTQGLGEVPMYFYFDSSIVASSANRPILRAKNVGIFSSEDYEYCITEDRLRGVLRDKKTITAFSTRWVDQKYKKIKLAINLYLLMKIRDLAKNVGGNIVVYIREARELFPNQRNSDKSMKVLAELAEDMIKDCRKAGVHLLLDTQSPWDLPEGVLDQITLRFIFRHDRRESDIIEMYKGIDSMEKERIQNIRRLRKYHFYISHEDFSIADNSFFGNMVTFKLSDHLQERQNELTFIKKTYPNCNYNNTNDFLVSLRANWYRTHERYSGKFQRRYIQDQERAAAKSIGMAVSDMRILKYLHKRFAEDKIRESNFISIQKNCGLAKSTTSDSLDRLQNNSFITRGDRGIVKLLNSTIEFINENKVAFGLVQEGDEPEEEIENQNVSA